MKKTKRLFTLAAAAAMMLSGCSLKKETKKPYDMPSDNFNGRIIMETENGYYYNTIYGTLSLRYTEKSTGTDIFLCAKPECMHDGSLTCTATYDYSPISNTILYDNYIYFVIDERTKDNVGFALYKAALDGSSLDKVGDVAKIMTPNNDYNSTAHNFSDFVIHKGYAYIPYTFGQLMYGQYIEGGFVKMNIQTGETETIFSCSNYDEGKEAMVIGGAGDYLYYTTGSMKPKYCGTFRRNVVTGEEERIMGTAKDDNVFGLNGYLSVVSISESAIYLSVYDEETNFVKFIAIDSQTLKPNGVEIIPDEHNLESKLIPYEDKIYILGRTELKIFSDKGELIKSVPCAINENENPEDIGANLHAIDTRLFAINNGKIYIGVPKGFDYFGWEGSTMTYCSVEDVLSGNVKWEKAYEKFREDTYFNEPPLPKFIERLNKSDSEN